MNVLSIIREFKLICFTLLIVDLPTFYAIIFNEVSSLANRDPGNPKSLIFRQIELNWINAPLEDENDYIGLYLDSQPDDNVVPVSVHRLNGQMNGHIITDYYLPHIDFYNETFKNDQRYLIDNLAQDETTGNSRLLKKSDILNERRFDAAIRESANKLRRFNDARLHSASLKSSDSHSLKGECFGYCLAYHSRNKILASNCLRTNPDWMKEIYQYIGPRSLLSLMIPGTHNSGTYPMHLDKTVLHLINKYQINQDESIFNQLVYGIRHLDLRVGYTKVKHKPERLWIYHDIFRTEVSVNEVLAQVRKFLDMTTHEIIIMDFHRFTVGFQNENLATQRERHSKLIDMIFKQLGQYIIPSFLGQHAPLNEYIAVGKRLVIGYANRNSILGSQAEHQPIFAVYTNNGQGKNQVRDIDAAKQDQEEIPYTPNHNPESELITSPSEPLDRRVGTSIYNRLKSLKLISNSFSKRSSDLRSRGSQSMKMLSPEDEVTEQSGLEDSSVMRAALFFLPVRHLWANKDTLAGLEQYMNETTCRKYFGELRSMMAEMTPTVFGAISDKYDGNRKLAQLANRPITDWIRDRWLHCINIVATDFFLGNDLIQLSIYANKMRVLHQDVELNPYQRCRSFRKIESLLDKTKIPIQFAYQRPTLTYNSSTNNSSNKNKDNDIITHTSSDGNKIFLRPLTSNSQGQSGSRERRDSLVENISDGFTNLVSSFKRILNL